MSPKPFVAHAHQNEPAQLLQVVLVNSLAPREYVSLPVDGATVVTGNNTGGKTSLLKLIPVFLGTPPASTTSASAHGGSKSSFSDYYLERPSSYIVFEYRRHTGQICMAAMRNDNGTPSFFLVKSAFRPELFMFEEAGVKRFVDGARIINHINSILGPGAANAVATQMDYRRIIVGDMPSHKEKRLGVLVSQFSLVQPDRTHRESPLLQAHQIAFAMLKRSLDFRVLRDVIIASTRNKNNSESRDDSVVLNINERGIHNWVDDVREFRKVQKQKGVVDKILELDRTTHALSEQVAGLALQSRSALEHTEQALSDQSRALESDQQSYASAQSDLRQKEDEARARYHDALAAHEAIERSIKNINDRKEAYNQIDIQSKCQLVDNRQCVQSQMESAVERFERLDKASGDLRRRIEEQKALDRETFAKRLSQLNAEYTKTQNDIRDKRDKVQSEHNREMAALRAGFDTTTIDEAIQSLREDKAKSQTRLHNPERPKELDDALASKKTSANAAQAQLHQHDSQSNALGQQIVAAERANNRLGLDHEQAVIKVQGLHKLLVDTRERLSPPSDSLHAFLLAQEDVEAASILGSLIRKDVLLQTNLQPEMNIFSEDKGVYGLHLDISRLPTSYIEDNKNKLESQIKDVELRLDMAKRELDAVAGDWGKAQAAFKSLTEAKRLHDEKRPALEMALNVSNAQIEEIENQLETYLKRVKVEIAAALAQIDTNLFIYLERLAEQRAQHSEALERKEAENKARLEDIKAECSFAEAAFKRMEVDLKADLDIRLNALDEDLRTTLESNGVDPTKLQEITAEINKLKARLNDINDAQSTVDDYRRWFKSEWQEHLPQAKRDLEIKARTRDQAKGALDNASKALRETLERHNVKLDALRGAIRDLESAKNEISALIARLDSADISPDPAQAPLPWDSVWTPSYLREQIRLLLPQLLSNKKEIKSLCAHVLRAFETTKQSSTVHNYFTHPLYTELRDNEPVKWLKRWFEDGGEAESSQSKIIEMMGFHPRTSIDAFINELYEFRRSLNQYNETLQRGLASNLDFDIIRDVRLNIMPAKILNETISQGQSLLKKADEAEQDGLPSESYLQDLIGFCRMAGPKNQININLGDMIEVSGEAIENGERRKFRNAHALKDVSSNGGSYLVMIILFVALTNGMRGARNLRVHWPLDEVGDLARSNTDILVKMLKRNNIEIVAATPDYSAELYDIFGHVQEILPGRRLRAVKVDQRMSDFKNALKRNYEIQ